MRQRGRAESSEWLRRHSARVMVSGASFFGRHGRLGLSNPLRPGCRCSVVAIGRVVAVPLADETGRELLETCLAGG